MKKIKEKVDNLLSKISKETKALSKVNIYREILKLNNTDKTYVKDYLILLKECTLKNEIKTDELKNQLELYKKVISKDEFNKEFYEFESKEKSSFEEIKYFLEKIKAYNFNAETLKDKSKEYKFIGEAIEENSDEIKCNSPITYDNTELYIYFLFHSYLKHLEEKIENYKNEKIEGEKSKELKEADQLIEEIESEYPKLKCDKNKLEAKEILKNAKNNRKLIILFEGKFIKLYLVNFKLFIKQVYDDFVEKFQKSTFEIEDLKLLEKFMIFISEFNFEKLTDNIILIWKYSFKDLAYEKKLEIIQKLNKENPDFIFSFEIDENKKTNLKIDSNARKITISDIHDYIFVKT